MITARGEFYSCMTFLAMSQHVEAVSMKVVANDL